MVIFYTLNYNTQTMEDTLTTGTHWQHSQLWTLLGIVITCSSNHNTQTTGDTLTADPTVDSTENGHFLYILNYNTQTMEDTLTTEDTLTAQPTVDFAGNSHYMQFKSQHTDNRGHTDGASNCGHQWKWSFSIH